MEQTIPLAEALRLSIAADIYDCNNELNFFRAFHFKYKYSIDMCSFKPTIDLLRKLINQYKREYRKEYLSEPDIKEGEMYAKLCRAYRQENKSR